MYRLKELAKEYIDLQVTEEEFKHFYPDMHINVIEKNPYINIMYSRRAHLTAKQMVNLIRNIEAKRRLMPLDEVL